MKKFFVFLLIFVLPLCSCSSDFELKEHFSLPATVCARLEGTSGSFTVFIDESESLITFSTDHALRGILLRIEKDKCFVSDGKFYERDIRLGSFPAQESLCRAIKLLASTDSEGIIEENRIKYTIDETVIIVYYDYNSDKVTHIETEENRRRFIFAVESLQTNETQSNG